MPHIPGVDHPSGPSARFGPTIEEAIKRGQEGGRRLRQESPPPPEPEDLPSGAVHRGGPGSVEQNVQRGLDVDPQEFQQDLQTMQVANEFAREGREVLNQFFEERIQEGREQLSQAEEEIREMVKHSEEVSEFLYQKYRPQIEQLQSELESGGSISQAFAGAAAGDDLAQIREDANIASRKNARSALREAQGQFESFKSGLETQRERALLEQDLGAIEDQSKPAKMPSVSKLTGKYRQFVEQGHDNPAQAVEEWLVQQGIDPVEAEGEVFRRFRQQPVQQKLPEALDTVALIAKRGHGDQWPANEEHKAATVQRVLDVMRRELGNPNLSLSDLQMSRNDIYRAVANRFHDPGFAQKVSEPGATASTGEGEDGGFLGSVGSFFSDVGEKLRGSAIPTT